MRTTSTHTRVFIAFLVTILIGCSQPKPAPTAVPPTATPSGPILTQSDYRYKIGDIFTRAAKLTAEFETLLNQAINSPHLMQSQQWRLTMAVLLTGMQGIASELRAVKPQPSDQALDDLVKQMAGKFDDVVNNFKEGVKGEGDPKKIEAVTAAMNDIETLAKQIGPLL